MDDVSGRKILPLYQKERLEAQDPLFIFGLQKEEPKRASLSIIQSHEKLPLKIPRNSHCSQEDCKNPPGSTAR